MRVILYQKGILGQRAYDQMAASETIELFGLCRDSFSDASGKEMVFASDNYNPFGVPVYDIEQTAQLYLDGEITSVVMATDNVLLSYASRRLLALDVIELYALPEYYGMDEKCISDNSYYKIDVDRPRLEYMEYHISFHCNLNCKGCSHFSNLMTSPRFGRLDQYTKDLHRLRELFWGIGRIRLMGGEPLLNPELPDFLYVTRDVFPDADVRIVSNALLLRPDMDSLFMAMRDCSVYFDVSMYPPTGRIIDRVARICEDNGVMLTVTPAIEEFTASLNPAGDSDAAMAYAACPASHCTYLCDGKLSVCAMPQLISIYNEAYEETFLQTESDVIDIYDKKLQGIDVWERLKQPMETCRYCSVGRRHFDWTIAQHPHAKDWLYDISGTDG